MKRSPSSTARIPFSFRDSDCLKYFPTLVPRQRFEAIRSLKLFYYLWDHPSEDPVAKEDYEEIWRVIASMPRLRKLWIQLKNERCLHDSIWKANEAAWIAPLKGLKGLEVFELGILFVRASEISKNIDIGECGYADQPLAEYPAS